MALGWVFQTFKEWTGSLRSTRRGARRTRVRSPPVPDAPDRTAMVYNPRSLTWHFGRTGATNCSGYRRWTSMSSKAFFCKNFRRILSSLNGRPDTPESGTKWHLFDAFQAFVYTCTRAITELTGRGRCGFTSCCACMHGVRSGPRSDRPILASSIESLLPVFRTKTGHAETVSEVQAAS